MRKRTILSYRQWTAQGGREFATHGEPVRLVQAWIAGAKTFRRPGDGDAIALSQRCNGCRLDFDIESDATLARRGARRGAIANDDRPTAKGSLNGQPHIIVTCLST